MATKRKSKYRRLYRKGEDYEMIREKEKNSSRSFKYISICDKHIDGA